MPRRPSHPGPARRPGPRRPRRQHRDVRQAVQRQDGVVITVYSDRSFEFKIKSPPAAILLKLAAKIPHAKKAGGDVIPAEAKKGGKYKGFAVTSKQVREIAQQKLEDLNARDVDHAARIIAGTARSMGLTVTD